MNNQDRDFNKKEVEVIKTLNQLSTFQMDESFKQRFMDRILLEEKTNKPTLFFNANNLMNRTKLFLVGIIGVLSISMLAGGTFFLLKENSQSNLSDQEIFANILKNNSTARFRSQGAAAAEGFGAATKMSAEMASDAMVATSLPYFQPDYKFRHTKTAIDFGPAFSECKLYFQDSNDVGSREVTELYEYFDNQFESYYKSSRVNNSGDIIDYYLSINLPGSNTSYEYRGGSFAVKTVSKYGTDMLYEAAEEVAEFDAETENTTLAEEDLDISEFFGPDAKVVETVKENGEEYYVIEYSFDSNCDGYASILIYPPVDSVSTDKIVTRQWVNTDNFEIIRTENYLDSVSSNNLISSEKSDVETSNAAFEEVSSNFNFDYDVEIKEVVYDNTTFTPYDFEKEIEQTIEFVRNNNFEMLSVNNFKISSIFISDALNQIMVDVPETQNHYADRNFYAPNEFGQQQYEMYNRPIDYVDSELVNSSSSYSFTKDDESYISVTAYPNKYSQQQVIDATTGSNPENVRTENVSLVIDGNNVNATKYTYEYAYAAYQLREASEDMPIQLEISPEPVTNPPSNSDLVLPAPEFDNESTFLYFVLNGQHYVIFANNANGDFISQDLLDFNLLNSNNSDELVQIESLIQDYYNTLR